MLQYIVFSFLCIAGLVVTLIQEAWAKQHWSYPYLSQISSTLLVGGVLSLLYKIFIDRYTEKRLRELLRIHDSVDVSGLREVQLDSQNYNFSEFLARADVFEVVMNDGLRWIGNYSVELEKRFARGTSTSFFFADPAGLFLPALALKTGVAVEDLKSKIVQTEALLKETYQRSSKKGLLEIYHLKNYPTQSIFASEDHVVVTPYQCASGRRAIPLFIYEDNSDERCYVRDVKNDLKNVRNESKLVFSSAKLERAIQS